MSNPIEQYRRDGYAVARGVFTRSEVAELAGAFDRIYEKSLQLEASFRDGNYFVQLAKDAALGRIVRLVKWPAYKDSVFARYRLDPRMLALVEPLIGRNVKQITNQLHWKRPGAADVNFAWHQDWMFRKPESCYRDLDTSYVQTGIAVDPHTPENGAMRVARTRRKIGKLDFGLKGQMPREAGAFSDEPVLRNGVRSEDIVDLVLEPGDVALWGPFTPHGSGPNRTAIDRRFFINGYVRAEACDRGEWAFRDGRPVPLGDPVLVQFEDLFDKPGPHYVDRPERYAHD